MATLQHENSYKKSGQLHRMYIMKILGLTAEQKASYKAQKGEHYRDTDNDSGNGTPLLFTRNWYPNGTKFAHNVETDKFWVDTEKLDTLAQIGKQYGAEGAKLILENQGMSIQSQPVEVEVEEVAADESAPTAKATVKTVKK